MKIDISIYTLKVTLMEIKPEIWRRFTVSSDVLLPKLHQMLQTIMGWTNSHLHQFIKDEKIYCEPSPYDEMNSIDYRNISLEKFLKKEGDQIIYEYDFGDGWRHNITLEKIIKVPLCLEGERACPPEDCGSFPGYENLVEIIKDPSHKEYNDYMTWLGGSYDPELFEKEKINKLLRKKYYGMPTIDDHE
ncbi:plasmid pRiA4b ORF-3 family protein [Bacteroidota bacterium]